MIAAIDFESYYAKSCDIGTLGAYHYLRHPKVDVYLVSVVTESFEWVGHPKDFDWRKLDGAFLVAHNLAWDGLVLAYLIKCGIVPQIKLFSSGCTANLSVYLGAPRNLAGAAKQLIGVDVAKDMRTWMKGKTWADAVAAGRAEELQQYALRDARACYDIWKEHSASWPGQEQALARMTMLAGWQGFKVDSERVTDSIRTLDRVMFDAEAKLPWADSDSAILSPKALGEACRAVGNRELPANIVQQGTATPPWFEIIVLVSVRALMNSTVSLFMRFQTAVNGPETLWTNNWNTGDSTPLNWSTPVTLDVTAQFSIASASNKIQVYHGFAEQL